MKSKEIINEAREWIDTPFHHQASIKNVGSDCAGLVRGVGIKFGEDDSTFPTNYSREPSKGQLESNIKLLMTQVSVAEPGDIILFKLRKEPQHLGILTDIGTIIHAFQPFGKVAEHRYDSKWQRRAYKFYRYKLKEL